MNVAVGLRSYSARDLSLAKLSLLELGFVCNTAGHL